MKPFSSLTNRIFFATALIAVLTTSAAIYVVNKAVSAQAESELVRGLNEAGTLVDEYRTALFEHFKQEARLIADLPLVKSAAFETDVKTLTPIALEYQQQINADLFMITDRRGNVLVRFGAPPAPSERTVADNAVQQALKGHETTSFWPEPHGILQVASVPFLIGRESPEILGTLSIGIALDDRQAARFKSLTDSDVAFGVNGTVQSATVTPAAWAWIAPLLARPGTTSQVNIEGNEYIAVTRPLLPGGGPDQPRVVILRSRTERLKFLTALHTKLAATAVIALLVATLLSYAIARTVTRPLGTITATMREMAATGDLTRRIPVRADARWQDEDARLLAATFNTMTDSIARFQREAAQRERLSALGRLSTIVAHEIRNPLMIIKAALRALRREDAAPAQLKSSVDDIDGEITRLNKIVSEVLDFARPIKFELAPADLNTLAREAARAAGAAGENPAVRLDLDTSLPMIETDADRLRQAIVNIVGNAVQAVEAKPQRAAEDGIRLSTRRQDGTVAITVRDSGAGIAAEDLPRIFDPYFTTRRTGTGIGLAITRNIVEGLGGRITVASERGKGTEVRIELPLQSPPA
jgi:signal transduction histidine kinase